MASEPLASEIAQVQSLDEALSRLRVGRYDLILLGPLNDETLALAQWQAIEQKFPNHAPCVVIYDDPVVVDAAVLMRRGIGDCLRTNQLASLPAVAADAISRWRVRRDQHKTTAELARAMRRAAELSDLLQLRIEEERQAIAREVHDDIGGSLAAVKFDLAWMSRHCKDSEMLSHVQTALELLDHAVQASQRLILDLRPPLLDQGLVTAIDWLGRNFGQRTKVSVQFEHADVLPSLPDNIQLVVYRTAQEALTNITKYAQCRQARLSLRFEQQVLTLVVSDDGTGLPEDALDKPRAFGLRGLVERAESVGGSLRVESEPGQGTTLTLTIPLRKPLRPARRTVLRRPSPGVLRGREPTA
ncbi:sensor histidine kinase [Comamonadaceae bacterium PP-2]